MDEQHVFDMFHPAVREWFTKNIGTPSPPQSEGWPEIRKGNNVLISAPTGTGKTLAAFLESINRLLVMGIEGNMPEGVYILYVSPLKALNNDIYKNLDVPLEGISAICRAKDIYFPEITKSVRTGDTPQHERQKMLKKPPHILITTPESLFLMLTSIKARDILRNVKYLIVDEIHTMIGTKRGVHLALSVERLEQLSNHNLVRIGLSATINPIESAANYLGGYEKTESGYRKRRVGIVNPAMERKKDLRIMLPVDDFRVLEEGTVWPEIYKTVAGIIKKHKSTIVFVNNRATAEKLASGINSIEDNELCMPHHGSISKAKRLEVEERFKTGGLKCLVATSTLELGIDIGHVEMMVQVAPPATVSSGLQRLGRAGHNIMATSTGRIIPRTRMDLLRSVFMCMEMLEGNIETEIIPLNCLDVLAQHIVSICCSGKRTQQEVYDLVRCAWSYNSLGEQDFIKVLAMLAGGYEHMEDIPAKPRIIWNRQEGTIEGNTYSRMLAVSSGGTIPDRGYYPVYLEDYKTRIGELDEVFVFEARIGDRFMLGNSAWRIVKIDRNRVIVRPSSTFGAKTPFWQGDGIGAPYETWIRFGRLLDKLSAETISGEQFNFLYNLPFLDEDGIENLKNFLTDQMDAMGCLSSDKRIVVEYLNDEVSDRRIIIHSHFGGKVNSVIAVLLEDALEKAIKCNVFTGFTNDAILVHIYGSQDKLDGVLDLLSPDDVAETMLRKLPGTSRFAITFRYNAYRALIMGIRQQGKRLPLWIQRLRSVDALETAQKYMNHPLIIETMRECLGQVFDIPNTVKVLQMIKSGEIEVVESNTYFPSPFASELMLSFQGTMMYEEKSSHPGDTSRPLISGLDTLGPDLADLKVRSNVDGKVLDDIIHRSNAAHYLEGVASANNLHSFLLTYGDIPVEMLTEKNKRDLINILEGEGRAVKLVHPGTNTAKWIAVEEAAIYGTAENLCLPEAEHSPYIEDVSGWTHEEAAGRILRRYARYHSPFTRDDILRRYNLDSGTVDRVLALLKSDKFIIAGDFNGSGEPGFCHFVIFERALKKSINDAARAVKPRSASHLACFMPFWQNVNKTSVSQEETLYDIIKQMEGLYLPADWWEEIIFPARIHRYSPSTLDSLCRNGRIIWRTGVNSSEKSITLAWYCTENIPVENIPVGAGNIPVYTGNIPIGTGNIFIGTGNALVDTGDISAGTGNTSIGTGNITVNTGNLPVNTGNTPIGTGNAFVNTGHEKEHPGLNLIENQSVIYSILKSRGASFAYTLTSLTNMPASDVIDTLEELMVKGLVVNDSFQPVRYYLDGQKASKLRSSSARVKMAADIVSRPNMGRWEIAGPPPEFDLSRQIDLWLKRYGILCKEITVAEQSKFSWQQVYERLKVMEYTGEVVRGYFIEGISGIQFMLPEAAAKLDRKYEPVQVLNACDPCQVYGSIVPHNATGISFMRVPGTALVIKEGNPLCVLERFGERITFGTDSFDEAVSLLDNFKKAFYERRIWPQVKKIEVKIWPEEEDSRDFLRAVLKKAGFERNVTSMVLYKPYM